MAVTPIVIGEVSQKMLEEIEGAGLTVSEARAALSLVNSVIDNRLAEEGKEPWSISGQAMKVED